MALAATGGYAMLGVIVVLVSLAGSPWFQHHGRRGF